MTLQPGNDTAPVSDPAQSLIRAVMPELDTIRGIAILAVLLLHAFAWQYSTLHFGALGSKILALTQPGGFGVNLFFVLSGFLITGILLDSRSRPHFYRTFYTRRALRILPAYYALLILLLLLRSASLGFVGLSFFYLSNVTNCFGVANGYGPLWSLAVEEHYYILWPAVVHKLTSTRLAMAALGIVTLVPVLRAVSFSLGWIYGLSSYTWFVADGLAMGSLVAIALRTTVPRKQVMQVCASLLVLGTLLGVIGRPFGIATRGRLLGAALQHTTVNMFCAGVLLLFLLVGTGSRRRFVNSVVLRFFGYISYGLYLDHILAFRMYDKAIGRYWPALTPAADHFELVFLRFVLAGGFAIGMAYVSRRYFEEKFLKLKGRLVPDAHTRPSAEPSNIQLAGLSSSGSLSG